MSAPDHDAAIIGGGIVGMATAMALASGPRPSVSVGILEAEDRTGAHQSSHNSGVVHSGIFNRPGTLKARLCVEGREALYRFCREHAVAHERCGKVIVATRNRDLSGLHELEHWARANGLAGVRRLDPAGIREHEPHAVGIAGLFVPESGITDYGAVTTVLAEQVRRAGGVIRTGTRVLQCRKEEGRFVLETTAGAVTCRFLVNCAGLQADRIARICGVDPGMEIVPFRGQFYELASDRTHLVRNLIYPVPDLRLPFLGVHITRTLSGTVEADPNGALSLDREGYALLSISARDVREMLAFGGFWPMLVKHLGTGLVEALRAVSRRAFVAPLQRMVPELRPSDFHATRAGVHAQAVTRNGQVVEDFQVIEADGMVHLLNATSPAATASLSLGRYLADSLGRQFADRRPTDRLSTPAPP